MEPKFIETPEKKVVGLETKFISIRSPDKNNMKMIPVLWDRFMEQMDRIKNRVSHACFGLVEDVPETVARSHKDELVYVACVEVSDLDAVPPGMTTRVIPAGRHAVFVHKGKLEGLQKTMDFIYGKWISTCGLKVRNAPHIEIYDHRFCTGSDESEFDILVPVE
jgi:AraC family transcriptional regulator